MSQTLLCPTNLCQTISSIHSTSKPKHIAVRGIQGACKGHVCKGHPLGMQEVCKMYARGMLEACLQRVSIGHAMGTQEACKRHARGM